jgi:hypothetical protein
MPRIINSWSFPEGLLFKAIAVRLYDKGLRGNGLLEAFEQLVPKDWQSYFKKPINRGALVQRADKARRYANEAPENNPRVKPYWRIAGTIVRKGKRLTKQAIAKIIRGVG